MIYKAHNMCYNYFVPSFKSEVGLPLDKVGKELNPERNIRSSWFNRLLQKMSDGTPIAGVPLSLGAPDDY